MKEVLILDVMMSYGHQRFNFYYLKILSKYAKLYVVNNGEYYSNLDIENIEFLECHSKVETKNPALIRGNMVNTFKKIKRSGAIKKIDAIIVMGYDTLSFPLFFLICKPKVPIYTFQHHNIDETQNAIKRLIFNSYKNKMIHIVLEEKFIDMLREECGIQSRIEYIPHFLSREGTCTKQLSEGGCLCALSNSNDEEKIKQLIILNEEDYLKKVNIQIYAKSNCIEYESENLKIMKGYVPEEIYNDCFKRSKAILVLFPDTYRIRFSGTLLEALVNHKLVLGYHIPIVSIYKEKYSNNVLEFDTSEQLKKMLTDIQLVSFSEEEREKIIVNHSEETIEKCMKRIFNDYEFKG